MVTVKCFKPLSVLMISLLLSMLIISGAWAVGDVNSDSKNGLAEAVHAMEVAANLRTAALPAGDVNGDSVVDLSDAIWVLNILTGSNKLLFRGLTADFGDLDDATFPTLQLTQNTLPGRSGPHHFDVSHEWIGSAPASTTDTEVDAKVIDLDTDDGVVKIYTVSSCGTGCTYGMVSVTVSCDTDPAVRYLNVAADLNHDGQFSMYPVPTVPGKFQHEWLLINMPVMSPGSQGTVGSSFRIVDPQALVAAPCVRATLSTEMIDPNTFGLTGWDGSGPGIGFSRGETEDHCPQTPGDPFPSQSITTATGVWFPVWPPKDIPPLQWPPPSGPHIDGPSGPLLPLSPPGSQKDVESYPPITAEEEDGSRPFAEPPVSGDPDPFLYKAKITTPKMPNNKQTGDVDCAPTAAANSIEYLMNKAGLSTTGFEHGELKEIMSPSSGNGMMDAENGTGTTISGFRNGKRLASEALAGQGKGIKTSTTSNPSFMNIYEAVNAGKDVEIAIAYEVSDPPGGHMVVVTGATMDRNGNMTLTFVDPGDPPRPVNRHTPSQTAQLQGLLKQKTMVD